jgi:hypothetical protein
LFRRLALQNVVERYETAAPFFFPSSGMALNCMIASAASLLIPLALTAGLGSQSPTPSLHHDMRAYVTGYNTVAGQTDLTPCLAASGANICGRRDAVDCPRGISLGTMVEIRGTSYVCEDRLAKKFDTRFDISCDKDTKCPPQVTGWADIKVFDVGRPQPAVLTAKAADTPAPQHPGAPIRLAQRTLPRHAMAAKSTFAALHPHLAAAASKVFPPARPQLAVATANFIARTTLHTAANMTKSVAVLRGHT